MFKVELHSNVKHPAGFDLRGVFLFLSPLPGPPRRGVTMAKQ